MDSNETFDGSMSTPSVVSVIVAACTEDLGTIFKARTDELFDVVNEDCVTDSHDVRDEIRSWITDMEADDAFSSKMVALVRSNPGWEVIIANRVIRELRRRQP